MTKTQLTKELKAKKKRLESIQEEINWYNPKPSIATAMLKAGELGFSFSGHGCGFGSECFGLILYYDDGFYYLDFQDHGNKVVVDLDDNKEDSDEGGDIYEGRISGLWKHIDKIVSDLAGKKKVVKKTKGPTPPEIKKKKVK